MHGSTEFTALGTNTSLCDVKILHPKYELQNALNVAPFSLWLFLAGYKVNVIDAHCI